MRPSEALARHRDEVLAIIAKYPVANPRVFGSVARGEDVEGSDIDLLVEPQDRMSYFDLAKLASELEAALGCRVDVGEADTVREHAAASIFADARPL